MELWGGLQDEVLLAVVKGEDANGIGAFSRVSRSDNEREAIIAGGPLTCSTGPDECEPGLAERLRPCRRNRAAVGSHSGFPSMWPWTFVIFAVDVLVSLADWL